MRANGFTHEPTVDEPVDSDTPPETFDVLELAFDLGPALTPVVLTPVETTGPRAQGFTHESSINESVEWYTPPEIFDALGLTFDLDPCSPGPGKSYVPTLKHYTIEDDGLTSPWQGSCWVNPPYGPHTKVWMEKLAAHGDGMALVFARTDVKWFQEHGVKADMVCFVSSRIRFYQGSVDVQGGTPGAGSMILAYGEKCAAALAASGLGACFTLVPGTELKIEQDPQLDLFADYADLEAA